MDIFLVAHNSEEYWECVKLRTAILRTPLGLKFSEHELEQEHNQFHFALKIADELLGCLSLVPLEDYHIKMRQVAVVQEAQGKGIGKALVKFVENWSKAKGYHSMILNARETAMPFYKKLDYQMVKGPFIEVGIAHYQLKKQLYDL